MSSVQTTSALQRAKALQLEGRTDQAIKELIQHLGITPDDGSSWELLGILLFDKKETAWAQAAFEKATSLIPVSARGQVALGKCYQKSGHRQAASAIYRHLASLDDLAADLLEPLASGLGACGELELALNTCRKAANVMPDNPDPLVGMAHYMLRLRRPTEHILPILFRAHQLEPDNAEYRITLAWMLHESGCSEDAINLLDPLSSCEFRCASCLSRMAHIYQSAGKDRLANECRNRIVQLAEERPRFAEHFDRKQHPSRNN